MIPPEVQLLDITGPVHIFYEAKEYGAEINTLYLSMTTAGEEISSAGLALGKLRPYEEYILGENDLLFIPGMESHLFLNDNFITANSAFFKWLRDQHKNGAKICSVCTGAYILAFAGLLDGKSCTTHWKYFDDFSLRFPNAQMLKDRLLVKDNTLYSSAGVSSGIDLALFLLEELFGPVFASKIAKEVVIYLRRTERDPQLSAFLQYRNHVDTRIHQVQDLISQNLDKKIKIQEFAEKVYMSPRNLTRLFKKTVGLTLGDYQDKLRLELAQKLILEGEKISVVTSACGLKSTNQLRNLFKKYLKKLPSEVVR